jgi:hypothetical protein
MVLLSAVYRFDWYIFANCLFDHYFYFGGDTEFHYNYVGGHGNIHGDNGRQLVGRSGRTRVRGHYHSERPEFRGFEF